MVKIGNNPRIRLQVDGHEIEGDIQEMSYEREGIPIVSESGGRNLVAAALQGHFTAEVQAGVDNRVLPSADGCICTVFTARHPCPVHDAGNSLPLGNGFAPKPYGPEVAVWTEQHGEDMAARDAAIRLSKQPANYEEFVQQLVNRQLQSLDGNVEHAYVDNVRLRGPNTLEVSVRARMKDTVEFSMAEATLELVPMDEDGP